MPLIAGQVSSIAMGAVDIAMAGHFDAHTLGAVAVGANVWMLGVVLTVGVMMALSPSVAQLDGADRRDEIGALFRQALWLAAGVAVVVWWGARHAQPLLALLGVDPALVVDAQAFLHALSWGAPGLCGYFALRGLCEGTGWTRPTMFFGLFGLAVLAPLDWIFIYGHWGVPALGARGAGIANAIALWLQFAAFGTYVVRARRFTTLRLFVRIDAPDWRTLRELLWIGVPMAVTFLMEAGLFIISALLISRMGVVAIDGHQVAINVASLIFMVPLGLALAVTIRTGFAAGQGDTRSVRFAAYTGVGLTLVTQSVSATLLLGFPGVIARLYTDAAPVVALATQLLMFAGAFQIVDGIQAVSNGALRGLKDTRVPMLVTAFAYWGVGMPVGAWLAFARDHGPAGMWVGMTAGLSVAAVLLFWRLWTQLHGEGWRRFRVSTSV